MCQDAHGTDRKNDGLESCNGTVIHILIPTHSHKKFFPSLLVQMLIHIQ